MFLKWIHKTWKFLIATVVTLLMTLTVAGILLFGILQLPQTKEYVAEQLTVLFDENRAGTLEIGRLGGILPFYAKIQDVSLFAPDEPEEPVLQVGDMSVRVSLWDLIQRNITVHSFNLDHPHLTLKNDERGNLTIVNAFRPADGDPASKTDFNGFRIHAPSLLVRNGELTAENIWNDSDGLNLPTSLSVKNIETDLFLELTDAQRFLDIEFFSADVQEEEPWNIYTRGQIFSDDRFLEFNGFVIRTVDSQIEFTGQATPVNLLSPDFYRQLQTAAYRLEVKNSYVSGNRMVRILPGYPFGDQTLVIELLVEGTRDSLFVDRFNGMIGSTSVQLTGLLENIHTPDFKYQASISNAIFHPEEIRNFSEAYWTFEEEETDYLSQSLMSGRLTGDLHRLDTELELVTPNGELALEAALLLGNPWTYRAGVELDSLDLSPAFRQHLDRSLLNGSVSFSGSGRNLDELEAELSASLDSGYVNHIHFDSGTFEGSYKNTLFEHNLAVEYGNTGVRNSGWLRYADGQWGLSVQGQLQNIDLQGTLQREELPATSLNLDYNSELRWKDLDDLYGRVNFEVGESTVGTDTLRDHQFYADLNAPQTPGRERNLRLTSSFLDADLKGDIYPGKLIELFSHWKGYFNNQFTREMAMDTTGTRDPEALPAGDEIEAASLSLNLEFKDLHLFQQYLSSEPVWESRSHLNLDLNADRERILLTGNLRESGFRYGEFASGPLRADLTASFRYGENFRDSGTMDLQLAAEDYSYKNFTFREGSLNAAMRNDSLKVNLTTTSRNDNVRMDFSTLLRLMPESLQLDIEHFQLGNDEYQWVTEAAPRITYFDDGRLQLDNVRLTNEEEYIEVNGTFSPDPDDSVKYKVLNLKLERISELIGGRVSFAGVANGEFVTQSLTRTPLLYGNLKVEHAKLNDRLIGDLSARSTYSESQERFNTRVSVVTDPGKYPEYYAENDSIGQDLAFDGYFNVPDFENPDREFFHFDADFKEIDMWIATVIVPQIVQDVEGSSSGTASISGSLTDFDFRAEFDIRDVMAAPVFTNTRYNLNGNLVFDRHEGLVFNDLLLEDARGGKGRLYGTVDLDNFSETNYLDLTLDLDNLHFMNNPYDPDIPFYANARGSGQAHITGSNIDPFLRTTQPVVLSSGSRISVPVLDDEQLQQSSSFIQFVDTFDLAALRGGERGRGGSTTASPFRFNPDEMTFMERFTLDLQFIAENPVNFQLVFDRVTNEILTANGTGQVRVGLEDQNFSLFGRMNITGGDYQFVVGDIISRRFQLSEGGSIIWEGDPANARLNVNATYRARPDMASLVTTRSAEGLEGSQRIPVDLVLHIGGTLVELENDFYFQVPSSIEGTLDPTLLTQINSLNRNEDEKIIQATSILLAGNFIPLASATTEGGTGMALRESLTGGSVVNPLLTSQLINPLLSDQINSLLRSDMALDIDFNLTPYNQIDLGVALRLYDDRLILRRDGQITGPFSDIGDLGATYRINRIFAITAFHRQDPTLTSTSSSATEPRQVQEMNGIGLEAQLQFNTWKEFRQRIGNAVSRLFGRKEDDSESETEDEEAFEPIAVD